MISFFIRIFARVAAIAWVASAFASGCASRTALASLSVGAAAIGIAAGHFVRSTDVVFVVGVIREDRYFSSLQLDMNSNVVRGLALYTR